MSGDITKAECARYLKVSKPRVSALLKKRGNAARDLRPCRLSFERACIFARQRVLGEINSRVYCREGGSGCTRRQTGKARVGGKAKANGMCV